MCSKHAVFWGPVWSFKSASYALIFCDNVLLCNTNSVADLGEGPGGPPPPPLIWVKKKKSQKEEKPAGQAKQNHPAPPPPHLSSRSGSAIEVGPWSLYRQKVIFAFELNKKIVRSRYWFPRKILLFVSWKPSRLEKAAILYIMQHNDAKIVAVEMRNAILRNHPAVRKLERVQKKKNRWSRSRMPEKLFMWERKQQVLS